MNLREPWKIMPVFWIGAGLATWGYYVSLTASLLNLYRIQPTASPILTMMVLEAVIPLLFIPLLSRLFQIFSPKTLYLTASLLGMAGAGLQALQVTSLTYQFIGITLIASAMAIQRPLMMQVATFVTNSNGLRMKINNLLNAINYVGMLAGYVSSGLAITYYGYHYCFFLNAITFFGFGFSVLLTQFGEKANAEKTTERNSFLSSLDIIKTNPQLKSLFLLTFALWLTGGSINVLEVPFLKKTMAANDMIISLLFFTTAAGALGYSMTQNRSLILPVIRRLPLVTGAAGALILLYVITAKLYFAVPALLLFGYLTSFYNVISMNALQTLTPQKHLGDATLALNTTAQTTTLLSAASGVFLSRFCTEQSVCILFAIATILLALYSRQELVEAG